MSTSRREGSKPQACGLPLPPLRTRPRRADDETKEKAMPDPKTGAQRVNSPGVVTAEDPATGEPDPSVLKEAMERASKGDKRMQDALDDEDAMKRRVARGGERQNDAGN